MTHVDLVGHFLNGDNSELMQIQRTMNMNATGNLALDKNLSARIKAGSRQAIGADGKGMRIFKGIISGGLPKIQQKIQENKPAAEPSTVPTPTNIAKEKPSFNWLLWGGIGGGVLLLGIGGLIWYKSTR